MIVETIVKETQRQGITRYKIWQDLGIDQSVLHRLFNGGSASLDTIEKLCKYLELELKPIGKKSARKGGK